MIRGRAASPVARSYEEQLVYPQKLAMLDTATGPAGQHRDLDTCICQPFQLRWLMERAAGQCVRCIHIDYHFSASVSRLAQAGAKWCVTKCKRSQGHFISAGDPTEEMIGHCVGLNTVHQTQELPASAVKDICGVLCNSVVAREGVAAAEAAAIIMDIIVPC